MLLAQSAGLRAEPYSAAAVKLRAASFPGMHPADRAEQLGEEQKVGPRAFSAKDRGSSLFHEVLRTRAGQRPRQFPAISDPVSRGQISACQA